MKLLVRVMGHSNLFKSFSDDNTITNHNCAACENHAYGTENPCMYVTSTKYLGVYWAYCTHIGGYATSVLGLPRHRKVAGEFPFQR
jgi:hypothetical protein